MGERNKERKIKEKRKFERNDVVRGINLSKLCIFILFFFGF